MTQELQEFLSSLATKGYLATGWVSWDKKTYVYSDDTGHPGLYREVNDSFENCECFTVFKKELSPYGLGSDRCVRVLTGAQGLFLFVADGGEDNSEEGNGFETTYVLEPFSEEKVLSWLQANTLPDDLKAVLTGI